MALNILNSKIQVVRAFTICREPCSPYLYSCQLPAVNHKNTPCRAQDHAQSPSQKMPRTFLSLCSFVFNFADFLCVANLRKLFFFHFADVRNLLCMNFKIQRTIFSSYSVAHLDEMILIYDLNHLKRIVSKDFKEQIKMKDIFDMPKGKK